MKESDRNGVIKYYIVLYKALPNGEKKNLTTEELEATLSDLKKHTNYSIEVLAATKIGEGPSSIAEYGSTEEDGEAAGELKPQLFLVTCL